MRSAPAVTVRCAGGLAWRSVQRVLPALAAAAVAFWLAQHAGLAVVLCLAAAFLCGLAAASFASIQSAPAPELRWDGAVWTCDDQPVRPQVMIDSGGSWMLLRLHVQVSPRQHQPDGATWRKRSTWVAVSKGDCAADWHGWRAAVYCPPPDPSARGSVGQSP